MQDAHDVVEQIWDLLTKNVEKNPIQIQKFTRPLRV